MNSKTLETHGKKRWKPSIIFPYFLRVFVVRKRWGNICQSSYFILCELITGKQSKFIVAVTFGCAQFDISFKDLFYFILFYRLRNFDVETAQ